MNLLTTSWLTFIFLINVPLSSELGNNAIGNLDAEKPSFPIARQNESLKDHIGDDCKFKDIPLYGKVKFVESFADIKIQFVESFPDIKVKFVESFPNDCGKWQVVESFPDFTVQVVTSFPDLKVKTVDSFPGMR